MGTEYNTRKASQPTSDTAKPESTKAATRLRQAQGQWTPGTVGLPKRET